MENQSVNLSLQTRTVYCALIGVGSVGRNLINTIITKSNTFINEYHLKFKFVFMADSSGSLTDMNGINIHSVLNLKNSQKKLATYTEMESSSGSFISQKEQNIVSVFENLSIPSSMKESFVVFEASPVNLKTGDPGLSICKSSLSRGLNVVLANKGPLVLAFHELHNLASTNNVKILYSATVCGGLPLVNIGRYDMIGAEVSLFRGVFNSTTNFILEEMSKGREYSDALKEAQDRGIAETDPSLDVEGWDTANKLLICCNSILRGVKVELKDIQVEGITKISKEMIDGAKKGEKVYKLVASAVKEGSGYKLTVAPTILEKADFLAQCTGWEMGAEIHSDLYGIMYHKLYEREPIPTSSSMLRDAVNIFTPFRR